MKRQTVTNLEALPEYQTPVINESIAPLMPADNETLTIETMQPGDYLENSEIKRKTMIYDIGVFKVFQWTYYRADSGIPYRIEVFSEDSLGTVHICTASTNWKRRETVCRSDFVDVIKEETYCFGELRGSVYYCEWKPGAEVQTDHGTYVLRDAGEPF